MIDIEKTRAALGLAEDLRVRLLSKGLEDLMTRAEVDYGEDAIALAARVERAAERIRAALASSQGPYDHGNMLDLVESVEDAAAGLPPPPTERKDAPWRVREDGREVAGKNLRQALQSYVDVLVRDVSRVEAKAP